MNESIRAETDEERAARFEKIEKALREGKIVKVEPLPSSRTQWSIGDIKAKNRAEGWHFFDRDTLRFFNSIVHDEVYAGPGGVFFVTSEKPKDGVRRYSVRQFDQESGRCFTPRDFENFRKYETADAAHAAARSLARYGRRS